MQHCECLQGTTASLIHNLDCLIFGKCQSDFGVLTLLYQKSGTKIYHKVWFSIARQKSKVTVTPDPASAPCHTFNSITQLCNGKKPTTLIAVS